MSDLTVNYSISADLSDLALLRERIAAFLGEGVDETVRSRIILSVDEAVANIILHGYIENGITGEVRVEMKRQDGRAVIVINDDAPPFNPLLLPFVDVEEREISCNSGGLGVHNYTRLMEARYIQTGKTRGNCLILSAGVY